MITTNEKFDISDPHVVGRWLRQDDDYLHDGVVNLGGVIFKHSFCDHFEFAAPLHTISYFDENQYTNKRKRKRKNQTKSFVHAAEDDPRSYDILKERDCGPLLHKPFPLLPMNHEKILASDQKKSVSSP